MMRSLHSSILASAVLLCFVSACLSRRYISPQEITPETQKNKILIQQKDGPLVEMRSPRIIEDRIIGIGDGNQKIEIPISSIQSVQIIKRDYHYPILLAGMASVAAFLIIGMETAPSPPPSESCPFVYSFDGHHWVLEAEPYGGAFCQALERAEWVPLDRIEGVDDRYRILIGNELNEAQYIDEMKLVVVDHQKGVKMEADAAGGMHALAAAEPPLRAFDEQGNDVLAEITATDYFFWQSPLSDLAAFPPDGRDELVLEFPKPASARKGKLQINAWTTPWGAAAAGDYLALYGNRLRDFYANVNRFGPAYYRLMSWFLNEELYLLKILVETRDGWKVKGLIYGGGPYMAKTKAYAIDISDVPGEILRIKLRPPHNFWMFDSLAIDYSADSPVRITEVGAENATAPWETALSRLCADDDSYLILNRKGESVELTFRAPPKAHDCDRTVFLKAKGYYDIHIDAGGEPRWDIINRIYDEPGFCVRLANERFQTMIQFGRWAPCVPK